MDLLDEVVIFSCLFLSDLLPPPFTKNLLEIIKPHMGVDSP